MTREKGSGLLWRNLKNKPLSVTTRLLPQRLAFDAYNDIQV